MTDFSAISTFVRVVEAKSFVGAARQMNMSSSGVSRAITRLESQVGARLLARSTRSLTVTEEGANFYNQCVRILADIDKATESIGQSRTNLSGKLRVAVPTAIGRSWLIPQLSDFHQRYPDIQLDMNVGDNSIDLIESGTDCAIRVGELADSSLVARRIGAFRVVTCASPGYLEQYGAPTSIDELNEHRCISFVSGETGKPQPWVFQNGEDRFSMDIDSHLRINDMEGVMHAAVKGLGLAQTGDCTAAHYLKNGFLKLVLPEAATAGPPIWIVYPQRKLLTARTQAFIDWIADLFARSTSLCSAYGLKPCREAQWHPTTQDNNQERKVAATAGSAG